MILCYNCTFENEDSSDFCEQCGEKLSTRTLCCPDCGLFNKITARFCNSCGTNLQTGTRKTWILENRYEIDHIIKSGAMGAVYKAIDTRLGIRVAVKKLFNNGSNEAEKQEYQKMFEREAKILASLHHSNLPKVNDYFSAPDDMGRNSNFLVMSLIEGEDLETYLSRNKPPLALDTAQNFILKILDILEYLHSQNPPVIYRDLKPSNIMHNNGTFFLIDFGIAKALETGKAGTMMGTAGYASPDQCRGNDHLSNDIYSLGVLFHYLLTGINPEAKNVNLFTFEPIRKFNSQLPEHIENLIESMVAIRICDRPASTKEVKEKLKYSGKAITPLTTDFTCTQNIIQNEKILIDAIKNENFPIIKNILSQGTNINCRDTTYKMTPLHWSAYKGYKDITKFLLNVGGDLNAKTNKGSTPLHIALYQNNIELADLFIHSGSNVNIIDNFGKTPFMMAIERNFVNIITTMISQGADLYLVDYNNETPLDLSKKLKKNEITKILSEVMMEDFLRAIKQHDYCFIKNNFNLNYLRTFTNSEGWTILHFVAYYGNREIAEFMIKKLCADDSYIPLQTLEQLNDTKKILTARDNEGWTPLHIASHAGNIEIVKLLINNYDTVIHFTKEKKTPLELSKLSGQTSIVKILREATQREFEAAVKNLKWDKVQEILEFENNSNINIETDKEKNLIHIASRYGDQKTIILLLRKGMDINIEDVKKQTPLHYAVINKQSTLAAFLLKNGANPDLQDVNTWTPLHHCAKLGHYNEACLLIKYCSINIEDAKKQTPLHYAVINKQLTLAAFFLTNGANPDLQDVNTWTPLHHCAKLGHYNEACLLIKYCNINIKDKNGNSAIDIAYQAGHINIKKLLEGIIIEKLIHYIKTNNCEKVKDILQHSPNVNVKDNKDKTPLYYAVSFGKKAITEQLINSGADLSILNSKQQATVLHKAADKGFKAITSLLIKNKAHINSKDKMDRTPLHWATQNGHLHIVKLLIFAGADRHHKDQFGMTPCDIARQRNYSEISSFLLSSVQELLIKSIETNDYYIISSLINQGLNINSSDNQGRTLLHWSIYNNSLEIVELLLKNKADINAQNNIGWTPIFWSAENGNVTIAKLLIQNGAIIKTVDINGSTPLHIAVDNCNTDIVKYFLSIGADINTQDKDGMTALHIAALSNNKDICRILIDEGANINIKDNKGKAALDLADDEETAKLLANYLHQNLFPKESLHTQEYE